MNISRLMRRRKKGLLLEEKHIEQEAPASSGFWDSLSETGLTNSNTDDKIIPAKEILTLDPDGEVAKFQEDKIKKKLTPAKGLDYRNLNVGYYILVPILGGLGLGVFLDNQFKTRPFFIGVFLFLGTVAGFYNLFKLMKE